ncbi:MAG: GNAT family N-acetyltransferase [Bacillota bacterium]
MFRVLETDDYRGLTELFYRNGLEITPGQERPGCVLKCWEVIKDDTGKRVGGISLEKRDGEFVVGDIAIEKDYRRLDLGTMLMDKITEEVKVLGGGRMMLVAKVPSFFKTLGFLPMDRKNAPNISNCLTCRQFQTECFPEIMYRDL